VVTNVAASYGYPRDRNLAEKGIKKKEYLNENIVFYAINTF
jgi:hypothetical protein